MSRRLLTCVLLVISVTAVFANSESLPDEVVVIETPAVEEVIVVRESPVVAAAEEYAVEHVPSEIADVEPLGIVAITTDDEEKVVTSETAFLLIEPTATTAAVLSSPIPIPTTPIPTSGVDAAAVALVLLFIAIAATWRSLAALGDAQFDNEFYQKGVYSVRWLTESLGTLTLAFYFGVTAVAELFEMRGLVTIIKTLASSFFYLYMAFLWRVLSDAVEPPEAYPRYAIPELRSPRAAVHRGLLARRLVRPRMLLAAWALAHARSLVPSLATAGQVVFAACRDGHVTKAAAALVMGLTALLPLILGSCALFSLLQCSSSDLSSASRDARESAWLWPIGQTGSEAAQRAPPRSSAPLRIALLTVGTRGDVQPYVSLAQHLRDQGGHSVIIATSRDFKDLVENAGIEFGDIGVARIQQPASWLTVKSVGAMIEASAPAMVNDYDVVSASFARFATEPRADVVVGTAMTLTFALNISEARGIPAWIAKLAPDLPTGAFAPPGFDSSVVGAFNYLSAIYYWLRVALAVNRTSISAAEDVFRQKHLGLGPVRAAARIEDMGYTPQLLGFSRALAPAPLDWPVWAFQCGFWLTADTGGSLFDPHLGQVSRELRSFMAPEAGRTHVACITLGSMTNSSRPTLIGDIVNVTRRRGLRVLLIRGWTDAQTDIERGLPAPGSDDGFLAVNEAPHSWVFPLCQVVVHHGGAGTTSRALASGAPSLIIPVLRWSDQWTWGVLAEAKGVGVLLRTRDPGPAAYAAALERVLVCAPGPTGTLRHPVTDATNFMGASLRGERACSPVSTLFESCLCNLVLPPHLADAVATASAAQLPPLDTLTKEQRMCIRHCVQCVRARRLASASAAAAMSSPKPTLRAVSRAKRATT